MPVSVSCNAVACENAPMSHSITLISVSSSYVFFGKVLVVNREFIPGRVFHSREFRE